MEIQEILTNRKQTEREERVDTILNAARKMFLKKGYLKTTMRGISVESQLSTGAIYFYFKNKEEIFARIILESLELLENILHRAEIGQESGMKKMRAVMLAYFHFYSEYNEHYRLLDTFSTWKVIMPSETTKKLYERVRPHLAIVESCMRRYLAEKGIIEKDCWRLTLNLWAGVEGLFSIDKMGYLAGEPYSLAELIDQQLDIFEQGLLRR